MTNIERKFYFFTCVRNNERPTYYIEIYGYFTYFSLDFVSPTDVGTLSVCLHNYPEFIMANSSFCCKRINWSFHYIFFLCWKQSEREWRTQKISVFSLKKVPHNKNELAFNKWTAFCFFLFWFDSHGDYLINNVHDMLYRYRLSDIFQLYLMFVEFHYMKILLNYAASNISGNQKRDKK